MSFGFQGVWNEHLVCGWLKIEAIGDGVISISFPESHCCDMGGAIKFAKSLMPDVKEIRTYSGSILDAMYLLNQETGRWMFFEMVDGVKR